ncbi:MAG: UDP-N-acetylmuramoyl-L-alanine--D-glutamate ligase [Gammaproteobacteria bacterium]
MSERMNASPEPGHAVIVGLGRTGLSCARWLRTRGWRVAVTDSRDEPPELPGLRELGSDIPVALGGLDASLLDEATLVVASPGVALSEPLFDEARHRGLEIVGDIELFARAVDAPVVGITGTNGKSTVTTLLGRMAERAGIRVRVGGNLGEPALDLLPAQGEAPQLYVLELSSFQLESTSTLAFEAASVLNLTPDHLDRYVSIEEYAAAKARIFERCKTAVINLDDPLVIRMPHAGQRTLGFSLRADSGADFLVSDAPERSLMRRDEPLLPVSALKIAGLHNAANALAALALGEAIDLPMPSMLTELAAFPGLPHRAEWVAEIDGVAFVNDSKGTNVGATLAAVAGMPGPLVMIAGGDGKNQDFAPLAAAFRDKVRHAVLIGRDAGAIAKVLRGVCRTERCASLETAVRAAARAAKRGDTVLLSPACASLDMFRDYAHRGAVFTQAVKELAG